MIKRIRFITIIIMLSGCDLKHWHGVKCINNKLQLRHGFTWIEHNQECREVEEDEKEI